MSLATLRRKRPIGAARFWYIDEVSMQYPNWAWSVGQSTSEYFKIIRHSNGVIEGYLGRLGEPTDYFESPATFTYFFDYYNRKKVRFTFDGIELFQVESILPGNPMLFVLKKVNPNNMNENKEEGKNYNINVTGHGNTVTAGDHNQVSVQMQWKGDIGRLRSELEKHGTPAADIEEIVGIVQQEAPDASGNLPVKAKSWLKKMYDRAVDGIWHVSLHAAGALLAESIKAYYGLPF